MQGSSRSTPSFTRLLTTFPTARLLAASENGSKKNSMRTYAQAISQQCQSVQESQRIARKGISSATWKVTQTALEIRKSANYGKAIPAGLDSSPVSIVGETLVVSISLLYYSIQFVLLSFCCTFDFYHTLSKSDV